MNPLISAGIGLLGVALGAFLTYWREHLTQRKKDKKDLSYLAALVSAQLDRFVSGCCAVVGDEGLDRGNRDEHGYRRPQVAVPTFDPLSLNVEWRSLPSALMFDILDMPYRIDVVNGGTSDTLEYAAEPPDFELFFEQRQYEYAKLGLHAADMAKRLRKLAGYPERQQSEWDPLAYMLKEMGKIEDVRKARLERGQSLPPPPPPNAQREDQHP